MKYHRVYRVVSSVLIFSQVSGSFAFAGGVTRDLTGTFMRTRSVLHRPVSVTPTAPLPPGDTAKAEVTFSSIIQANITELGGLISEMHSRIRDIKVERDKESRFLFEPEKEVNRKRTVALLEDQILGLAQKINLKIENLGEATVASTTDLKLRSGVQKRFRLELASAISEFRKSNRAHPLASAAGAGMEEAFGNSAEDTEGLDDSLMDREMSAQIDDATLDADERVAEIQQISKSVQELAGLFRDLQTIIVEQGTMLDRIDHSIDAAVEDTREGHREIKTAEKYQKKSHRASRIIYGLLGGIAVCVTVIVAKVAGK